MCLLNKYYKFTTLIITLYKMSACCKTVYFICVQLILHKLTVAELKHVLKRFDHRVGGNKSVLQSRVTRLLQLEGCSKVGPVILQIPTVVRRIGSLPKTTNTVQSSDNQQNACQCNVKFKETIFYTKVDTLVEPSPLGRPCS